MSKVQVNQALGCSAYLFAVNRQESIVAPEGSWLNQSFRGKESHDVLMVFEAGKVVADRALLDNSLMQTRELGRDVSRRRVEKEGSMVTRSRARSTEVPKPSTQ